MRKRQIRCHLTGAVNGREDLDLAVTRDLDLEAIHVLYVRAQCADESIPPGRGVEEVGGMIGKTAVPNRRRGIHQYSGGTERARSQDHFSRDDLFAILKCDLK